MSIEMQLVVLVASIAACAWSLAGAVAFLVHRQNKRNRVYHDTRA